MFRFVPYLMFFFSGNMTNFPALLQSSSTCKWSLIVDSLLSMLQKSANLILRCEANA